ncbi:MAG: hypothetical protein MAG795_00630 [Candidatus Woesearchaeota archaeon]|nr:hypothetical protein [Candidatus Woesearchaeota archaeon]
MESYTVVADHVPAKVTIYAIKHKSVPLYHLEIPSVGIATKALLDDMVTDLASKIKLSNEDIIDAKKAKQQKQKFFVQIKKEVKEKLGLPENKTNILSGILLHKMYGLGDIDIIMADNQLEEIAINSSKGPLTVYHKKYGWCKTNKHITSESEIYNLSSQIGRKVGTEINALHPIMDAHLLSGDRVASTLFPITTFGNTLTIRRFARNPWTTTQFLKPEIKTLSVDIAAFLWLSIQYELNILVAGGTASGKTSMLNGICTFLPPTQRIISIEDTREIFLPKNLHWNWVPMTSRVANPEGHGEVTMLDLMVASLRMRPDRIIVGEVRRRNQAEALFEAMHTGHSVYATIHADTVQQVKRRLIEPPIKIPKSEIEALQLILVQYRDRRRGLRRSLELAEVIQGSEGDLSLNYLYRWNPRKDKFLKVKDSIRVFDDLNLHTGMTPKEINHDLDQKKKILMWMTKNDITEVDGVGKIMNYYYEEKNTLVNAVEKDKSPATLQ